MAKKEKGTVAPRKKAIVRTDAQLIGMGAIGKTFLVVRKSFALAAKNNFAGTDRAGKKFPAGILFSKGKSDGAYWKLGEDSAEFKKLRSAASKAISDLKALKYTDNVKAVVNEFSSMSTGGRGGSSVNMSSLEGLSL